MNAEHHISGQARNAATPFANRWKGTDTNTTLLGRVMSLDDHQAWGDFFDLYCPMLRAQALKAGLSWEEANDLLQEVFIELVRRIPIFAYNRRKGSFRAWLRRLTRWRIINVLQKPRPTFVPLESVVSESGDSTQIPDNFLVQPNDLDETEEQARKQRIFETALHTLRQKLSPTQVQVLESCIVQQRATAQVADSLQIDPARVSVMKYRFLAALRKEVERSTQ